MDLSNVKSFITLEMKKTDVRKDRKRNLVPVKIGIYGMIMLLVYIVNYAVTASLVIFS